jgi:hypothetical protein
MLPAAVLTLLMAACSGAQDLDTARTFMADLYASYQDDQAPDYQSAPASTIFAPGLLNLMQRDAAAAAGEVGIVDGDPVCDCQDPGGLQVQSLEVSAAGAGQARAEVLLNLAGDVRHLTFDLADTRRGWRIADVHSADTPSLVQLLEEGLEGK